MRCDISFDFIAPSRNILGLPSTDTMVDSIPFSTVPPSRSASYPSSPELSTSCALLSALSPDKFALVPTRYLQRLRSNKTQLLAGIRTAKLELPARSEEHTS